MVSSVLTTKRDPTYWKIDRKREVSKFSTNEPTTTTAAAASAQFIHFQLQLPTALRVITLLLIKLAPLAIDHGSATGIFDIVIRPCRVHIIPTMLDARNNQ